MIREHEEPIGAEATAGDHFDNFAVSPLGKRLMEIRRKFIAEGGKLLSREELEQEISERRGGAYAKEYEENNLR
jgi:hypothetical protein